MKYVIIGNGVAGVHAAEAIRQNDPHGKITMIGDETFPPYCRPMISLMLEGSIGAEKLPIRNPDFYEKLNIEAVLGSRIIRLDADNKTLETSNAQIIHFDKLLIATGADPRPIKALGSDLKNIFFMRTKNHVRQMIDVLPHAKNAVVLGGGLVGFKAAYALLHRGLNVTLLIGSDYPLSMQADRQAGKLITEELLSHGLTVKVNADVQGFDGNGSVNTAHLSDGTTIPCDLAVIGKGVLPAHSFVPRNRINVDLGILVSPNMETSVPGIYAAGDVAEMTDIARKTNWVNAILPEAVTQGRIAGMNMSGRKMFYEGSLSRNVIRIFDTDIMTAGLVNPPNDSFYEVISDTDHRHKRYRKLVFRDDRLVGMVMVNQIEQGGILSSLIRSQMPITIPKERLSESSFNYKKLI